LAEGLQAREFGHMRGSKPKPVAATDAATQKDAKTGRFLPGNSGFGGRPKGARSKLSSEFFDDLYTVWNECGIEVLRIVAKKNPTHFARITAMLMPKEVEIKKPMEEMSDAELWDMLVTLRAIRAENPGVFSGEGAGPASKPHKAPAL